MFKTPARHRHLSPIRPPIEPLEPRRLLVASGVDVTPNFITDFPTAPAGPAPANPGDIIPPPPAVVNAGFVGRNFQTSTRNDSGFIPPDTHGAVGLSHVIHIINGLYRVFSKDGALLRSQSLDQFWISSGVTPTSFSFDPRVLYDAPADRWYAISVDNARLDNNFLVAVSRTGNPLDGFVGFKIDSDAQTGERWADYPQFGFDSEGVYVTGNMFGISGASTTVNLLVLPKVDLLLTTPTVARRTLLEDIGSGFSTQPVVYDEPNAYPPELVSHSGSSVNFSTLGGTIFSPTFSDLPNTPVSARSSPPLARQPDGTSDLNTGDSRQQSSVYFRNGAFYGAHGVANGRAGVRFFRIGSNLALQQDTVLSDPVLDFLYPSLAVNADGEVAVGFTASGPNPGQFASAYAAIGTPSGPGGAVAFTAPFLTRVGSSSYASFDNSGRNRWGDYSATVVDPVNGQRFWTFQEFAIGASTWATQVTELSVDQIAPPPGIPQLVPASDTGISTTDGITSDNTPGYTGTAAAGAFVRLYAGGNLVGTGTSNGIGGWGITASMLIDGTYAVTATADLGSGEGAQSPAASLRVDTTAPAISGSPQFSFQTGQSLVYSFGEPVFPDSSAVQLATLPGPTPTTGSFVVTGSGTPSVTFTASPLLADGNYRATLTGAADLAGNVAAGTASVDFYVLAGDGNRDRRVDINDFGSLASNFNRSPRIFSQGDYNYTGTVDIDDFGLLAARFNLTLPPAAGVNPRVGVVFTPTTDADGPGSRIGAFSSLRSDARRAGLHPRLIPETAPRFSLDELLD